MNGMMKNYEKMVKTNRIVSKEKTAQAIGMITEMLQQDEKIAIVDLVERTGLSRGFFYKNETVRKELENALDLQRGRTFQNPRKAILDKAMGKQIVILEKKNEKLKRRVDDLENENIRLKKLVQKKELAFIKKL